MSATIPGRGAAVPRPARARVTALSLLAVALLTAIAFWPLHRNGFILFDDEEYITDNAVVAAGLTARGIALAFTAASSANWHPLTWLSHMTDVEFFGLAPAGHHLMGLAIHAAAGGALLLALQALTGSVGRSLVVAALFAVHPLHVESVAWASERKDVLAALFWALTTLLYVRHARRPSGGRYLAVVLCLALGLMAKQMLVTLPIVLLLLDWWPLGRFGARTAGWDGAAPSPPLKLVLEKVPLLAVAGLASLLALRAQTDAGLVHSLTTFPLVGRVANAVLAPVRYLAEGLWPAGLSIFYPYESRSVADPRVVAAAALLAAITLAAWRQRRRQPWLITGWAWYLVALLPVIGLVQVGDQSIADRYTYLPFVGLFIACAWAPAGRPASPALPAGAVAAAGAAALCVFPAMTRLQVALWRDDATLFGHAARVTRDNWLAVYMLGLARDRAGDLDGAVERYRASIRIKPDFEQSRMRLSHAWYRQGRFEEALDELRAGVAAQPRSRFLRRTLVRVLRERGHAVEALEQQRAAVAALPADPEFRISLVTALIESGNDDEAIVQLREIIRRWPELAEPYNNLAAILARRGRVDEAVPLLRRALELEPTYPEARRNLEMLTSGVGPGATP